MNEQLEPIYTVRELPPELPENHPLITMNLATAHPGGWADIYQSLKKKFDDRGNILLSIKSSTRNQDRPDGVYAITEYSPDRYLGDILISLYNNTLLHTKRISGIVATAHQTILATGNLPTCENSMWTKSASKWRIREKSIPQSHSTLIQAFENKKEQ